MIEPLRRELGDAAGQFKGLRNAELERRRDSPALRPALAIAAAISVRPWPALLHHMPAAPSMILRPSVVK